MRGEPSLLFTALLLRRKYLLHINAQLRTQDAQAQAGEKGELFTMFKKQLWRPTQLTHRGSTHPSLGLSVFFFLYIAAVELVVIRSGPQRELGA